MFFSKTTCSDTYQTRVLCHVISKISSNQWVVQLTSYILQSDQATYDIIFPHFTRNVWIAKYLTKCNLCLHSSAFLKYPCELNVLRPLILKLINGFRLIKQILVIHSPYWSTIPSLCCLLDYLPVFFFSFFF